MVQDSLNSGWVILPDDKVSSTELKREIDQQFTHTELRWVRQSDSYSCGPCVAALCILLLQGVHPTNSALWLPKSRVGKREGAALRHSILSLLVALGCREEVHLIEDRRLQEFVKHRIETVDRACTAMVL